MPNGQRSSYNLSQLRHHRVLCESLSAPRRRRGTEYIVDDYTTSAYLSPPKPSETRYAGPWSRSCSRGVAQCKGLAAAHTDCPRASLPSFPDGSTVYTTLSSHCQWSQSSISDFIAVRWDLSLLWHSYCVIGWLFCAAARHLEPLFPLRSGITAGRADRRESYCPRFT